MKAALLLLVIADTAFAGEDPDLPPPPVSSVLDPPLIDRPVSGTPDQASTTVPPATPPIERVFDSRDAFDSRRTIEVAALLGSLEFDRVFGEDVLFGNITFTAPVGALHGRLRISLGEGRALNDELEDRKMVRFALGWERWAFCLGRRVCPGLAADITYAYLDPLDGTLLTPNVFVDVKTERSRGFGARLSGGPAILMATRTNDGARDRFDVGWSAQLAVGLFAGW